MWEILIRPIVLFLPCLTIKLLRDLSKVSPILSSCYLLSLFFVTHFAMALLNLRPAELVHVLCYTCNSRGSLCVSITNRTPRARASDGVSCGVTLRYANGLERVRKPVQIRKGLDILRADFQGVVRFRPRFTAGKNMFRSLYRHTWRER